MYGAANAAQGISAIGDDANMLGCAVCADGIHDRGSNGFAANGVGKMGIGKGETAVRPVGGIHHGEAVDSGERWLGRACIHNAAVDEIIAEVVSNHDFITVA